MDYSNPSLKMSFIHDRQRTISNFQDRLVSTSIPLKPLLEYLNFKRNPTSFIDGPDGRKKVPGTDHTFWLTESNGKRKVRGYAFIKYGDNDKWGYFYTLELR
ncbi:hypothetical protein AAU57_05745 [Nonlabens sp. YIK11]|nr:hypothetical protein AAU57_05745 [Nonlabens sp. YIK11]